MWTLCLTIAKEAHQKGCEEGKLYLGHRKNYFQRTEMLQNIFTQQIGAKVEYASLASWSGHRKHHTDLLQKARR